MSDGGRKRGQHGPSKHFTEEERKEAIKRSKTKYMSKTVWYCDACPQHNYKLTGKHKHLQSKKHQKNVELG